MEKKLKKNLLVAIIAVTAVSACEVAKTPVPTGGSRADALVEMSFEVGAYETPIVDWDTAAASATKRCQGWGYEKADPFEGVKNSCQAFNAYGCVASTVTRTYQCL